MYCYACSILGRKPSDMCLKLQKWKQELKESPIRPKPARKGSNFGKEGNLKSSPKSGAEKKQKLVSASQTL